MNTSDEIDIDALIDEAQPAERSMQLCLRPDLAARFDELSTKFAEADQRRSNSLAGSGGDAVTIAQQMEELREEMATKTVTVVMRAMPQPAFQRLTKMHPPRRDDAGNIDPDDADGPGVNMATFWRALIRACWALPVVSKDRMTKLLDEKLTDRQFEQLANLAWAVNRGDVDIPFLFAASRRLLTSSPESVSPDSLASPSND